MMQQGRYSSAPSRSDALLLPVWQQTIGINEQNLKGNLISLTSACIQIVFSSGIPLPAPMPPPTRFLNQFFKDKLVSI